MSTDPNHWIKATASGSTGNCIEMRRMGDAVQMRDTKQDGRGPVLTVPCTQFVALLTHAKHGQLGTLLR